MVLHVKEKTPSINEHTCRYAVVEKAYGPNKNSKNPFERLRGIDGIIFHLVKESLNSTSAEVVLSPECGPKQITKIVFKIPKLQMVGN